MNGLFKQVPVYKVYLGFVGLLGLVLLIAWITNRNDPKKKAAIVLSRSAIVSLAADFKGFLQENKPIPLKDDSAWVQDLSRSSNYVLLRFTNAPGQVVDFWQTPLHVMLIAHTNFLIRSAGPNKRFSDKDDIVYDSTKNGFVIP